MEGDIFRTFCKYVQDHIFSNDNMGSYVALVIDQTFINDFCRENNTTEKKLMYSVRCNLWKYNHDDLSIKGIVAIQLYAASKRANNDGLTVKNYRDRLSQVIDWDINDLQQWMIDYQEDVWLKFYRWCESHYFQITQCKPRTGTGRYVQFPVNQALRVFTEEDLLYIAKCFVDKNLYPGEDISQKDFEKIVNKYSIKRYFETRHSEDVLTNSISDEDWFSQIYNFYLRWNGKYKLREKISRLNPALNNVFAYLTDDFCSLEIRDNNLKLIDIFSINKCNYSEIQAKIPFKRNGILLFKRDDLYDDRWQEVRYIEAEDREYTKESGQYGIVLCFKCIISYSLLIRLKVFPIAFETNNIVIYKITKRVVSEEFFTSKRSYELYGGFKIGRNTYLEGAPPILKLLSKTMVWVDGEPINENPISGSLTLNNLSVGSHYIKLPNAKKIKIDIVQSSASITEWPDEYNKWVIDRKKRLWQNIEVENGIVGLDFSSVASTDSVIGESVVRRWAKAMTFSKYHKKENNIAINLTKS